MKTKYRYERKFYVNSLIKGDLEIITKSHPALFSEIYYTRQINNIYFDTLSFKNFYDNVDGVQNRTKYRIRWYGKITDETNIPHLEVKIKKGIVGHKLINPMKPFNIKQNLSTVLNKLIITDQTPAILTKHAQFLKPTLFNSYKRTYYRSNDNYFRLTIDQDIKFYQIINNKIKFTNFHHLPGVILELKYSLDHDLKAREISNRFPFRMTKSSKYVEGINQIYPHLI